MRSAPVYENSPDSAVIAPSIGKHIIPFGRQILAVVA
jgi:hypothetical protein